MDSYLRFVKKFLLPKLKPIQKAYNDYDYALHHRHIYSHDQIMALSDKYRELGNTIASQLKDLGLSQDFINRVREYPMNAYQAVEDITNSKDVNFNLFNNEFGVFGRKSSTEYDKELRNILSNKNISIPDAKKAVSRKFDNFRNASFELDDKEEGRKLSTSWKNWEKQKKMRELQAKDQEIQRQKLYDKYTKSIDDEDRYEGALIRDRMRKAEDEKMEELRKQSQYKDIISKQEKELTQQYADMANKKTDWVKIAIYVIIAIIVAYIIYRIVKWLYRWYKKRKTAKQLQNESVSYNFFNYRLCEADETHQIGKLYNSMMSPIINFFKRVFSGSLSVLSYISNMISNFSKKVYQLFTNTFRQKKPMDKLKQEYSTISNKINNLCKSPILRSKLDNIQTVLPKV